MAKRNPAATLTPLEKAVIKALIQSKWRNQDILVVINTGRAASVNGGRISGVKNNANLEPASKNQVAAFLHKKSKFDHVTGLCPFDNERLVRAREAMLLAVELFNTPRIAFKAGVFSMLVNVSWTYLLHQFYVDKAVSIIGSDGRSLLLSQMIAKTDCPLSDPCKKNLLALKEIRDLTEHLTIGPFDKNWQSLFQANCLNFEKYLTEIFGKRLSLGNDLGLALQFAKLSSGELSVLQGFDIPPHIAALDASLSANLANGEADNLEYQFKVIYTLTSASKSKSHFQFIHPDSAEATDIQNVLVKHKPADELYPLKPSVVVQRVKSKSGRNFTTDSHQRAWKKYKARPRKNQGDPSQTDKQHCLYHQAHGDYTYAEVWVDFLVAKIADESEWNELRTFQVG